MRKQSLWRFRPTVQQLEDRCLLSLALVHQELHRPPMVVADVNGDGRADVIVGTDNSAVSGAGGGGSGGAVGFDVYLNNGKGGMQFASHFDVKDPDVPLAFDVAAGDVNGDGYNDVVVKLFSVTGQPTPVGEAGTPEIKAVIFAGTGKGDFSQRATVVLPHKGLDAQSSLLPQALADSGIVVADLDGDGRADIVSWQGTDVAIFRAGPRQTTSIDVQFNPKEYTRIFAAGDLDGDGRADLVFGAGDTLNYASFDFTSDGGALPSVKVNKIEAITIKQKTVVAVGDLDGDGRPDLVVMNGNTVDTYINNLSTGGGFKAGFSGKLGADPDRVLIGDLDGDGLADVFDIVTTQNTQSSRKKEFTGHVTLIK